MKQSIAFRVFIFVISCMASTVSCAGDPNTDPRPVLSEDNPMTVHGFLDDVSTSTEPVSILTRGITFRIPRNYLEMLGKRTPGSEVDFRITTLYPDFSGTTQDTIEQHKFYHWKDVPNIITLFTTTNHFSSEHDPNTVVFNEKKNEPDHPWKFGLLKSKESIKTYDIYFQRPTRSNPSGFVVMCINDELNTCTVHMRISSDLVLEYQFQRNLLPHWQEINDKMTKLIQSFIIKERK